jgi:16S rRNA C1402 N4-methylase RsmH
VREKCIGAFRRVLFFASLVRDMPAPPFRHVPVLLEEAVRAWRGSWPAAASPLFYADATVGGGGHSARLLALEPRACRILD